MVDVDVATVAVVEVDEDVLGVEVGPSDGAGVQVAQLQADTIVTSHIVLTNAVNR